MLVEQHYRMRMVQTKIITETKKKKWHHLIYIPNIYNFAETNIFVKNADLNCPAVMLSPVNRLFLASRRFSRSFLSSFYTNKYTIQHKAFLVPQNYND